MNAIAADWKLDPAHQKRHNGFAMSVGANTPWGMTASDPDPARYGQKEKYATR